MNCAQRREFSGQFGSVSDCQLYDEIQLSAGDIPGFFRIITAVFADDLADGLVGLLIIIAIDDKDHRSASKRNVVQCEYCDRNNDGKNDRDLGKPRTADNTHTDRPVQEYKIHGLFDCRTETDNGQSTDHTERNDDTGLDRQNDGCRDQRHAHKGDVEIF